MAGRHAVDNLHAVLQASSRPHALFAHNAILDQQQLFHSGEDHQGALWDDDAQALVGDDLCAREHARAQAAVFRLIDPAGLGRFGVLGLAKGMGEEPTALGWHRMDVAGELRALDFG